MKELGRHSLAIEIRCFSLAVGVGFNQVANNLAGYLLPGISCVTTELAKARVAHVPKRWVVFYYDCNSANVLGDLHSCVGLS